MKMENIGFFKRILNLEERIIEEVGHFYKSTKYLFSWQTILTLVLFSCFHWAIMVFANWALFISVGSEVPLHIILASMILNAIGSFISPTPGGIGLGDIPPVYFLYINGYRENVGAYLLLGRAAVYVAAFGWYFFSTGIYHKTIPAKVNDP